MLYVVCGENKYFESPEAGVAYLEQRAKEAEKGKCPADRYSYKTLNINCGEKYQVIRYSYYYIPSRRRTECSQFTYTLKRLKEEKIMTEKGNCITLYS